CCFFFSSRRRHTRSKRDWSSDVCSSDLEYQKEYVREKLSNEETGEIYGKRKIDVEPVFGFLKANLGFTRMSVRGKPKVHNEMGFALMAVNLRKYTAINNEN